MALRRNHFLTICHLTLVAFGRNRMCAKSQAAQSATQTPAPSGSMWRLCMALRRMSPRNSEGTCTRGPHPPEILAAIPSPGPQAGRLREPSGSRKTSAPLPQSGKNASRWRPSKRRSPWYVIRSSDFPPPALSHLEEPRRVLRGTSFPSGPASGHSYSRRFWAGLCPPSWWV